jgi:hypothetical protein
MRAPRPLAAVPLLLASRAAPAARGSSCEYDQAKEARSGLKLRLV